MHHRFVLLIPFWALSLTLAGCQPPQDLPPAAEPPAATLKLPGTLGLYYGWPSMVNGAGGDVARAAAVFSSFAVVVLGDGIEHPGHGDRLKTSQILARLDPSKTRVFGYVDLGVSTQNLDEAQMEASVDQWKALGAQGIFWDDAGFDYGVGRARQNQMVDSCHARGLSVIMNAWDVDDVAAGDTRLGPGDWFLVESSLVSGGKTQDLAAWSVRAAKVAAYQTSLGISVACLASLPAGTAPLAPGGDPWTLAWAGAALYGFEAVQLTDLGYSSSNNTLAVLPAPWSDLGTRWTAGPAWKDGGVLRSSDRGTLRIVDVGGRARGEFEAR